MTIIQQSDIILGIDPGSRIAGFALIKSKRNLPLGPHDFQILDVGVIRTKDHGTIPERLTFLHLEMYDITQAWFPKFVAIEKAFMGVNAKSALRLGEARGSLISAVHRGGAQVFELAPNAIKQAVTGNGLATKEQVKLAVKVLTGFENNNLPFDATDALATALAFGMQGIQSPPPTRGRKSRLSTLAIKAERQLRHPTK